MEIRLLEYFLAVAEAGNLTKAAEKLHISQPALSKQIANLEAELDCKLFSREHRQMILTDNGLRLLKPAREITRLSEKTYNDMRQKDPAMQGEIRIGAAETSVFSYISQAYKTLHADYPDIQLVIQSGNISDTLDQLDKGLLDFALIAGSPNLTKYYALPLPDKEKWGVILRKDHPLSRKKSITKKDFSGEELILSVQAPNHNELLNWFGASFSAQKIICYYNLVNNAARLLNNFNACLISFDHLIDTGPDSLLVFRPLEPSIESDLYFLWSKTASLSPAANLFLQEFKLVLNANK